MIHSWKKEGDKLRENAIHLYSLSLSNLSETFIFILSLSNLSETFNTVINLEFVLLIHPSTKKNALLIIPRFSTLQAILMTSRDVLNYVIFVGLIAFVNILSS